MKILKRIIMGSFLIYAFNMIAINYNVVLPINVWTISYTAFFGFPAIVILLFMKMIFL